MRTKQRPAQKVLDKSADELLAECDFFGYEELARVYSRLGLIHLEAGEEMKARECLQQATGIIERRKVGGAAVP